MEALLYIKLFFILFLLDFDFAYGKWTEKENFIFLQHVMLEPELLTENNSAVVLDELTRNFNANLLQAEKVFRNGHANPKTKTQKTSFKT